MAKLKTYTAKVNLLLEGKIIEVGETVELSDSAAERMSQVIEPDLNSVDKIESETKVKLVPKTAEVVAAIAELEVNDDNYTKAGKPDAVVLSDKLNATVSAKLRDVAWKIYQTNPKWHPVAIPTPGD